MGKRRERIAPIDDDRSRRVTFVKRKGGLMKKAIELSLLCDAEVSLIAFSQSGKMFVYSSSQPELTFMRYADHCGPSEFFSNKDYTRMRPTQAGSSSQTDLDLLNRGSSHSEKVSTLSMLRRKQHRAGNSTHMMHAEPHGEHSGSKIESDPTLDFCPPQFQPQPRPQMQAQPQICQLLQQQLSQNSSQPSQSPPSSLLLTPPLPSLPSPMPSLFELQRQRQQQMSEHVQQQAQPFAPQSTPHCVGHHGAPPAYKVSHHGHTEGHNAHARNGWICPRAEQQRQSNTSDRQRGAAAHLQDVDVKAVGHQHPSVMCQPHCFSYSGAHNRSLLQQPQMHHFFAPCSFSAPSSAKSPAPGPWPPSPHYLPVPRPAAELKDAFEHLSAAQTMSTMAQIAEANVGPQDSSTSSRAPSDTSVRSFGSSVGSSGIWVGSSGSAASIDLT